MATPNYSYEKRQRELAKKRKKEEKAARKAAGPAQTPVDGDGDADAQGGPADAREGDDKGEAPTA